MSKVVIDHLANTLSKISIDPEKTRYEVSNPLSLANAFVEIIIRNIYSNDKLNNCELSFGSFVNDGVDKIIITDRHNSILVESHKESIHELTRSALTIASDIIKEYHYHIKYNDGIVTIKW